jgi:hypothetical protein
VSVSGAADTSPRLVRCPEGLALVWTEHYFPTRTNAELTSVAYDRWADKSYRVAWLNENGQFDEPLAVRVGGGARLVSDRATPVAGRSGKGVWLVYGEMLDDPGLLRPFGTKLCRVTPSGATEPVPLAQGVLGPGQVAGAWLEDRLLLAETVAFDTTGPLEHTRVDLKAIAPKRLPRRAPLAPAPIKQRRPVVPGLMADQPTRGERNRVEHEGRFLTAFFGDLHLHSDLSWDIRGLEGSPAANYRAVHDVAELDFAGLSDHAEHLSPRQWHAVRETADLWNRPGHFVALPGYEWTSTIFGHKNVYFPGASAADAAALFSSRVGEDQRTPDELWSHLGRRAAITIPHHVSHALGRPTDWSYHDDRFQRLVEIFQSRGSYEYDGAAFQKQDSKTDSLRGTFVRGHSVRDALALGHRLGIIASPDHGGGLGLAGVWAAELTREALFEALYERRTFGTTGVKMDLFLSVAGAPLGSEVEVAPGALPVEASVHGTADGLELTLVCDGEELWTRSFSGREARAAWTDERPLEAVRYYYLRARQGDGHLGWTSPVWVAPAPAGSGR